MPFVLVEYVWLDAWNRSRSKTKVVHGKSSVTLADLGDWNYDGSSTGQAPGADSEVIIKPRALYSDPFRGAPHVLIMCDTYTPKGEPLPTNTRYIAAQVFAHNTKDEPWFGIEQEYVMFHKGGPLGWPQSEYPNAQLGSLATLGYPGPQGPYYCSAGADVAFGREIVEEHLDKCKRAGLNISGVNAEVMPGQWEYQVGPCVGIEAGVSPITYNFSILELVEYKLTG
jgi:glutamine synthetase